MLPGLFVSFAVAHRGLSRVQPENTIPAFVAAWQAGYSAVELDLRVAGDGSLLVLHDDTLERMHGDSGRAASMNYAAIERACAGQPVVPRLEDLFATMKPWPGYWNLELKEPEAGPAAVALVHRLGMQDRCLLSSMDVSSLAAARECGPPIPMAFIPLGPPDDEDEALARELGCTWLNVDHDFLDADLVRSFKQRGWRVGAWTVNEPAAASDLQEWGVDAIISDLPDLAATLRGPASW